MRPSKVRDNSPYEDLPLATSSIPSAEVESGGMGVNVPWPHFQDVPWHICWGTAGTGGVEMGEFIEDLDRWLPDEQPAVPPSAEGGANGESDAKDKIMVMDDDEDDEEEEEEDSIRGTLQQQGDGIAQHEHVDDAEESEASEDEEEEEEEEEDLDDDGADADDEEEEDWDDDAQDASDGEDDAPLDDLLGF